PSTTKQHKASWQSFATWCEERGIGQDRRLPAAETTLCDYASSWKGRKGSASLPSKMAGIKAVHIVNGVAWNGGQSLKRVMEGVKRLKPVEAARETRAPVTLERMEVLNSHLDPKDGKDACVAAIANIAFFGQCRLGELLQNLPTRETQTQHRSVVQQPRRPNLVLRLTHTPPAVHEDEETGRRGRDDMRPERRRGPHQGYRPPRDYERLGPERRRGPTRVLYR
ncbi:hypothetical protein BDZ89DRAFT_1195100, partial [Hymenopellis radicata]